MDSVTDNRLANWQTQSKHFWSLKPPRSSGGGRGDLRGSGRRLRERSSGRRPRCWSAHGGEAGAGWAWLHLTASLRGRERGGLCARGQAQVPWGVWVFHTHTESRYDIGRVPAKASNESLFPPPQGPLQVCSHCGGTAEPALWERQVLSPTKGPAVPFHRPGVGGVVGPTPQQRAIIAQELAPFTERIKSKFPQGPT